MTEHSSGANHTDGAHGTGRSRVTLTGINFLKGADYFVQFRCLYFASLGVADGMSNVRVRACRYSGEAVILGTGTPLPAQ